MPSAAAAAMRWPSGLKAAVKKSIPLKSIRLLGAGAPSDHGSHW